MRNPVLFALVLGAFGVIAGGLNGCTSLLGDFEVSTSVGDGGGGTSETGPVTQCTSTCATEGATQCATGKSQTCAKGADGCLTWSTPADCPMDQICCATACAPVDTANCYACGAACGAAAPRCLPIPKKCGCSVAICSASKQGCSPQTGSCEACTPLPPGATDIFVDATGFSGGTGTAACPFTTVTAAIAQAEAGAASAPITIHVAPGTYNAAAGEVFPLKLRQKSINLRGAGADKTTIQGEGRLDHSADGGQLVGIYSLTVLVGDETAKHTIAGLTLRAANDTPSLSYVGVLCDRGNAPVIASPPVMPFPEANLVLDKVTVGPGYDRGAVITTTTLPTPAKGCNAFVTGSLFTSSLGGIWAVGAGLSAEPGVTVALRAGTKTAGAGNMFTKIQNPTNTGAAIEAWDGAGPVLLQSNTVTDSNVGLALVNHARSDINIPIAPYYEVEGNTITAPTNYGIGIYQSMVVDKLNDNTITGAAVPTALGYRGIGVLIESGSGADLFYPIVRKARGNKIIGNEVGIEFRGKSFKQQPDFLKSDFGIVGEPGNNTIGCNSTPAGSALAGFDINVGPPSAGSGEPSFAGNLWDHAPPGVVVGATSTNGADIVYGAVAQTPSFTFANAIVRPGMCPAGHVPGP